MPILVEFDSLPAEETSVTHPARAIKPFFMSAGCMEKLLQSIEVCRVQRGKNRSSSTRSQLVTAFTEGSRRQVLCYVVYVLLLDAIVRFRSSYNTKHKARLYFFYDKTIAW